MHWCVWGRARQHLHWVSSFQLPVSHLNCNQRQRGQDEVRNGDRLTGTGVIFLPAPLSAGLAAAAEEEAEEDGEHHQSYGSTHSNEDCLPQREHHAISICREIVCMYVYKQSFKRKNFSYLQASKVSIYDYLLIKTNPQLYKCRAGNAGATIKIYTHAWYIALPYLTNSEISCNFPLSCIIHIILYSHQPVHHEHVQMCPWLALT